MLGALLHALHKLSDGLGLITRRFVFALEFEFHAVGASNLRAVKRNSSEILRNKKARLLAWLFLSNDKGQSVRHNIKLHRHNNFFVQLDGCFVRTEFFDAIVR